MYRLNSAAKFAALGSRFKSEKFKACGARYFNSANASLNPKAISNFASCSLTARRRPS